MGVDCPGRLSFVSHAGCRVAPDQRVPTSFACSLKRTQWCVIVGGAAPVVPAAFLPCPDLPPRFLRDPAAALPSRDSDWLQLAVVEATTPAASDELALEVVEAAAEEDGGGAGGELDGPSFAGRAGRASRLQSLSALDAHSGWAATPHTAQCCETFCWDDGMGFRTNSHRFHAKHILGPRFPLQSYVEEQI